jgi:group II intron reverse transcriptase/maturase
MQYDKAGHQKSDDQFELPLDVRGEAPFGRRSGEATSAVQGDERSGLAGPRLMEWIVEGGNLRRALKRVQQNQGSPGVDGLTVEALPDYLREHWSRIREELLTGRYQPSVVRRVELPKPDGGVRLLGIPTVLDRFIQQAVLQVLQPEIDPTFSESSYGFRPGRSAHGAVCQAQRFVQAGRSWVVDVDLAKFFDRVNHDILIGLVAKRITDSRVRKLIRRYLEAGVLVSGVVVERYEGTPQGGPLSPLLSNWLLDVVDKALERRGHTFVRFADDCNVYVRSRRAAERVMEALVGLYAKLKLQINPAKSAVALARERPFLSYSFWVTKGVVKRRIAPKALEKFKRRVRAITARMGGRSLADVVADLRAYLPGWRGYFRLSETTRVFDYLDKWIRHRLRALLLKQWKRGRTIRRELRRRGIHGATLGSAARYGRRWWYDSAQKAAQNALPLAYFDSIGVPRLLPS